MWQVYILFSCTTKRTYVGCTGDLGKRLKCHNLGMVKSTKFGIPWEIMYTEDHSTYLEVNRREKYFKNGAGRRKIKEIYKEYTKNM